MACAAALFFSAPPTPLSAGAWQLPSHFLVLSALSCWQFSRIWKLCASLLLECSVYFNTGTFLTCNYTAVSTHWCKGNLEFQNCSKLLVMQLKFCMQQMYSCRPFVPQKCVSPKILCLKGEVVCCVRNATYTFSCNISSFLLQYEASQIAHEMYGLWCMAAKVIYVLTNLQEHTSASLLPCRITQHIFSLKADPYYNRCSIEFNLFCNTTFSC